MKGSARRGPASGGDSAPRGVRAPAASDEAGAGVGSGGEGSAGRPGDWNPGEGGGGGGGELY